MRERIQGCIHGVGLERCAVEAVDALDAAEARITALEAGLREAVDFFDWALDNMDETDLAEVDVEPDEPLREVPVRLSALLAASPADTAAAPDDDGFHDLEWVNGVGFVPTLAATPSDAAPYSAPFIPTYEEAHNDLELSRCAKAGATERATINALAEALREARVSFARYMATDVRPMVVIPADPAAELAGLRACFEAHAPFCDARNPVCDNRATKKPSIPGAVAHRWCDAHAPPDATPLPWAGVVRGAK
jgi:hypothetical protein